MMMNEALTKSTDGSNGRNIVNGEGKPISRMNLC